MPLEVIYLTRHGFRSSWSVDPVTGVYSASIRTPTGIPADPALTAHGVAQAKEMGSHLMTLDPPIEAVYSSPYYRCLQTIAPFVELKKQQLENEPAGSESIAATIRPEYGLCEFFGAAPFEHPVPAPPRQLKEFFPAYDCTYVSALAPSRKGEGIEALYKRVAAAMQAIIDRCDAEGQRAVVLCTHAAVVIALGRVLTGNIPDSVEADDFDAYTCGLSVFRRREMQGSGTLGRLYSQVHISEPVNRIHADRPGLEDASVSSNSELNSMGQWDCEINGDCSFLTSGPERGWRFSGDESFAGTGSMSQEETESKL